LLESTFKLDQDVLLGYYAMIFKLPINGNALSIILEVTLSHEKLTKVFSDALDKVTVRLSDYSKSLDNVIDHTPQDNITANIRELLTNLKKYSYTAISERVTQLRVRTDCTVAMVTNAVLQEASLGLAQAQFDNPFTKYFCGNSKRQEKCEWYYRRCLQYSFRFGRSYAISSADGKVIGVIIWQHPFESETSLSRLVESGLAKMPHVFGPSGTFKFGHSLASLQEKRKQVTNNEQHLYLFTIGVLRNFQRQGYGSALLQPMLKDADDNNLKCYVECPVAESLGFF